MELLSCTISIATINYTVVVFLVYSLLFFLKIPQVIFFKNRTCIDVELTLSLSYPCHLFSCL